MFSGIIEEVGVIKALSNNNQHITIGCSTSLQNINLGDSIAVNGVCLTIVGFDQTSFSADIMPITLDITNLKSQNVGGLVNLERSLRYGSKVGGHLISGHVRHHSPIISTSINANATLIEIALPPEYHKFCYNKGSIAVNGISLTIAELFDNSFMVSIIPHTWSNTNLNLVKPGDLVNIEYDLQIIQVANILEQMKGLTHV